MIVAILNIDIYCDTPGSSYRLYANDDLLTERSFSFNSDLYIQEQIVLCVEPGHHRLRVEPLQNSAIFAKNLTMIEGDDTVSFSLS